MEKIEDEKLELLSHLNRRAGFGATRRELEDYGKYSYEDVVETLVTPKETNWMGDYLVRRFDGEASGMINAPGSARRWIYRMMSSDTPLKEKMTLFWHGIFATGVPKVINGRVLSDQIEMFRDHGLGRFDDLLLRLAKDPAMIVWLDNQENHKNSINENWGRELLELFSMGVGNYSEDDIKECAKAFTGWTIGNTEYMMVRSKRDSDWPYGRIAYHFEYLPNDHDDQTKEFLGHLGNFNGEDIIKVICNRETTAKFIARHLYHFFVADEVPVPSWNEVAPRDEEAIDELVKAYFDTDHNIAGMLSYLFNSDFFKSKNARYKKVKGPAEFAVGLLKLSREFEIPDRDMIPRYRQIGWMGQELNNPPSVEGWHEGQEWVNTGSLIERINFASELLGNQKNAGIKELIDTVEEAITENSTPEQIVDECLTQLGFLKLSSNSKTAVADFANGVEENRAKISGVIRLIGSTREFQMA